MGPAYDLLSFVARSENRLAALRALDGGPATRSDLQDDTGIPRATLSRILADCRDRRLLERRGREYALTPLGAGLVDALESVLDDLERLRALSTLAGWLALDDLEVDLFAVEDLEVTLPTRIDPMAPVGRAAAVVEAADLVRGFCYSLVHAPILAMTRDIVDAGGRFVGVVSDEVLEVVAADPALVGPVGDLLETGRAEVLVYDGGIETQFIVADDRTLFLVTDREGAIQGLVETGEAAIRAWAEARFDEHLAAAEPLDPDALGENLAA